MRIKNLGLYLLALLMLLNTVPAETPEAPPRGGAAPYFCILLGVSAGLSFATGNGIGVFASLASAQQIGCF
jgi:hypothetical protein